MPLRRKRTPRRHTSPAGIALIRRQADTGLGWRRHFSPGCRPSSPAGKTTWRRMGMSKSDPTIIIADDHPLFRVTLRLLVRSIAPQACIVEADSFDSLKRAAIAHPAADLALLDLVMPGVEGLSSLRFLRGDYPALKIAVISSLSQQPLIRSVRALGAAACIHKSIAPEQLRAALRKLLEGG